MIDGQNNWLHKDKTQINVWSRSDAFLWDRDTKVHFNSLSYQIPFFNGIN